MLAVITGLPGSGKTSYVVERILMPLAAKNWLEDAVDPDGNKVQVKRRLFTNINGLLLEHELMTAEQLKTWPEWVKPGDLIVFDEVQKPWPLTATGKEQPRDITELETHRHYGIDMYLLTQHPMLINAAIVRLAGQHLHVRKVGASRYATVYEWDGVSRTLLYKNSMAKKPWRRGKDVEKMYRSSSLHTKQARAIPTVLWVILACLIVFPVLAWKFGGSFKERYFGGKPLIAATAVSAPAAAATGASGAPVAPAPLPGQTPPVAQPVAFAGCARIRQRCECFDSAGHVAEKPVEFCADLTRADPGIGDVLKTVRDESPYMERLRREHWAANDREVLGYMERSQQARFTEKPVPVFKGGAAKRGD